MIVGKELDELDDGNFECSCHELFTRTGEEGGTEEGKEWNSSLVRRLCESINLTETVAERKTEQKGLAVGSV
jgi:hypothetical protein